MLLFAAEETLANDPEAVLVAVALATPFTWFPAVRVIPSFSAATVACPAVVATEILNEYLIVSGKVGAAII